MSAIANPRTPSPAAGDELTDSLFWLSRLDEGVPRASIVPDRKRSGTGQRNYRAVPFSLDAQVVRILKNPDKSHGVSDLVLCASLVAVLLAKYQRDEEFVFGLQVAGAGPSASAAAPLRVVLGADQGYPAVISSIGNEIGAIGTRNPGSAASMAKIIGADRGATRCPLFDVALAVGEGEVAFDFGNYPVDVAFLFDGEAGLVRGRLLYAAELFEQSTMDRLVAHFQAMARQIATEPSIRISEIDLLSDDERRLVLQTFQGRQKAFPLNRTLHGLFEDQVASVPDNVAVIHGDEQLSYRELNDRANRLAHALLSLGLRKGDFVGILLHRGCDFVTAMIGVFKAGGAYVPLDPTYPRERVLYMTDDSEASFLVTDAALLKTFQDVVGDAKHLKFVLTLDGHGEPLQLPTRIEGMGRERIASMPADRPSIATAAADRAYMIYTSGSTGRPKGAICRHNGAINHLYGELHGLGIQSPFRFLQTAASSSDISVWQFMAPLAFGGATVIADYDIVVDPERLFAMMRSCRVSIAEPVPVVFRALTDHVDGLTEDARLLPSLRYMMVTGEALAAELVDRWLRIYPDVPVANTYGPTETSDDVTLHVVARPLGEQRAIVPIGHPLPNTFVFVMDRQLRPVPVGVPGEICIGGIGVGEGYWRQPEKTAAAFVPCPVPEVWNGSMYRSGDLGRWLPDGSVEFLGRIDQQLKVRGFRVEPGEIESILAGHPAIKSAAVVATRDSVGNNRLLAYYVARKDKTIDPGDLRRFLQSSLADHMVPAKLIPLTALPLTPLGKVDLKALAKNEEIETLKGENYVAPRTDTERLIAEAWSKVLGQQQIGIDDNFFEIGGDSILTIHIITELGNAGLKISPREFFLHPTVAELADRIVASQQTARRSQDRLDYPDDQGRPKLAELREQLRSTFPDMEDVYPLAATQRGIYFQSILSSRSSGGYVEQIAFDLHGELDQEAFTAAWRNTAATNDVLRTIIVRRGVPQPMQVVLRSASMEPAVLDVRALSVQERASSIKSLIIEDRKRGFDLGQAPLMRLTLVRLADSHWHLLWTYHHIILDGWSEPLVLGDVFADYDRLKSRVPQKPVRRPSYRDFVLWSESQEMSDARDFWRQQLSGFVHPVKIIDNSPAVEPPSSADLAHGWEDVTLSSAETHRLGRLARLMRLTLSSIVHGSWGLLLHRHTGSNDVLFGSVASGRQCDFPDVDSIRGVIVATQPMRTRIVGEATFASWLRLLQLQMAEMREYEQTPLASIQQWCDVPPEKRPLFDTLVVMANYLGSDLTKLQSQRLALSSVAYFTQPLYSLTLFIVSGTEISIRLVYDKRRYARATVRGLLTEYRELLLGFTDNPEQRLPGLAQSHALS